LPENPKSGLGLAVLKLVTKPRTALIRDANLLVKRLKQEIKQAQAQAKLLELVEFVVISKLSDLSKEEVQVMLGLNDYRKSRFYQEARQDGVDEGRAVGKTEGKVEGKAEGKAEVALRMASKGYDAKEIADLVGLDVKAVRKILKTQSA
jgi:predicted transposase/invertase (TIGR01784 family)